MANISTASGSMVFFAKTKEDMAKVVQGVFGTSMHWHYATFPASGSLPSREDIVAGVADEGYSSFREALAYYDGSISLPLCYTERIEGDGRWSFDSNIESLGKWLESSDAPPFELNGIEFAVGYDNVGDVEFGCSHLSLYNALLYHKAGTPLDSMQVLRLNDNSYELTKENLAFVMEWDEDMVKEEWTANGMDED